MPARTKDRGVDAVASKQDSPAEVCTERFLNQGVNVELSTGETWTVKDLPFSSWLDGISQLIPVLMKLTDNRGSVSDEDLVIQLASDTKVRKALFETMARAIDGVSYEDVANLGLQDTFKVLVAFKQVINFEEVKSLFTQLGLSKLRKAPSTGRKTR